MSQAHKRSYEHAKKDPWFILANDPYHDYSIPISGFPDSFSESTTTQLVNDFHTITAPAGLPAGATWDCHVYTLPVNTTSEAKAFFNQPLERIAQDTDADSAPNPLTMGTVNVATTASGDYSLPHDGDTGVIWASGVREHYSFSATDDGNNVGMSRLIAGGYEVHNDTASLYKNGSVTSYSMPQGESHPSLAAVGTTTGGATSLTGLGTKTVIRMPPSNPGDARVLRNAQTWEAAQGVYCPFRLDVTGNAMDFKPVGTNILELRSNDNPLTGLSSGFFNQFSSTAITVGANTLKRSTVPLRRAPIETTGSYFTGLSPETVLTLTTRIVLENAPTAANKALLTTASPPAVYDPMVLQCYIHCLNELKPAAPVADNAKGDRWRAILRTLMKVQPNIMGAASALAPEYAPVISGMDGPVAKGLAIALSNSEARAKARLQKEKAAAKKNRRPGLQVQDVRRLK